MRTQCPRASASALRRILSCAALASTVVACSAPADAPSTRLDLQVSALSLPGIRDAVWDVEVLSGATPRDVVWQHRVTSSAFGDGRGSVAYVGPCDASPGASQNLVRVWVVGLYDHPVTTADAGEFASGATTGAGAVAATSVAFESPTRVGPLERPFTCAENADTPVRFDVTLLRPANQGFFDIAVSFNDIFCSAKLDCCDDRDGDGCAADGSEDLDLLFDASGARAKTYVMAFACTAGASPSVATELYLNPLELDCDVASDAQAFVADLTLDPTAGPAGNLCTAGSLSGCAAVTAGPGVDPDAYLYQVATYHGTEQLQSQGVSAQKVYWTVALGVNGPITGCRLRTRATADDAADATDRVVNGTIEAGAVYPYIAWDVNLGTCSAEPLGSGEGASVGTFYTGTGGVGLSFAYHFGATTPAGPFCSPACLNGGACVSGACDCVGTGFSGPTCAEAVCPPGHTFEAGACVPVLAGLTPSVGALSPGFAPTTLAYTVDVGPRVDALTLAATATSGIALTIAGSPVTSGAASAPLPLAPGPNTFVVTATSTASRSYTVVVVRDPSDVTPPEAPVVTTPAASPYTSAASTLALAGTCEPGATVAASGAGAASAPCLGGVFGLALTAVVDGTYSIVITQTDAADNVSPEASLTWVRDSAAPAEPVVLTPVAPAVLTNASPLGIAGTCTVGLTVELAGASVQSARCVDGTFAFAVAAGADGTYAYAVRQVKPTTGVASGAVVVTWTLDAAAPAAPAITRPATSPFYSASGLVTLGGTCEPGATVALSGDASESAPCADGTFAFDLVALVNGSWAYEVTQTDPAGNASAASGFELVRDDTIPEAPAFTSPTDPHHGNASPLTLAGTCTSGFSVHLTGAGAQTTTCAGGVFAFEAIAAVDGSYLYLVHQQSPLTGLRSSDDDLTWVYDTTAPAAPTLTSPASTTYYSAGDALTIAGLCEPGATVTLGGAESATTACDGAYAFVVTRGVNGNYDFEVTQTDPAGNTSAALGLEWTRDDTIPATPVVTSHASPYTSAETAVRIAGSCTTGFDVLLTGADTASTICLDGAFAFDVTSTGEGGRDYVVYQTNPRTGVESGDAAFTWIRDSVAPSLVGITTPVNPFTSGDDAFALVGTCEPGATVRLAGAQEAELPCLDGTFQVTLAKASDGLWSYALTQVDAAANTSTPVDFTWHRTTVIPPSPTIAAPSPSPYLSNGATLTIVGSCEDDNGVELTGDAAAGATCAGGAFTFTVGAPGDGTFTYALIQRSSQNGFASAEATVTWQVDRTAPATPGITAPAASPYYTGGASATLAGTCETDAVVHLGGAESDDATCVAGRFDFALAAAGNGTHDYAVTQTDPAGNTSGAASFRWISDDTVPSAPVITSPAVSPLDSAASSLTLSGTCTTDFIVYLQGASTQTQTCVGGAFSFVVTADTDDTYVYSLYQESHLTQLESATTSFTWRRDTRAPDELTVTSPPVTPYFSGDDTITIAGACEVGAIVAMSGAASDAAPCVTGEYAFTVTRTVNTTYNFNLVQTDGAGNASLSVLFQWVRDNTIPLTPVITSPATPHFTATSSVVVAGTCVATYAVHLTGASTQTQTCSGGAFAFTLTAATDGTRDYLVHQTNPLTSIASSATSFTWVRDTAAPSAIVITAPSTNPYRSGDTTFALQGTCEVGATVTLSGAQTSSLACAAGTFRFDLTSTTNGTYDYALAQADRTGNVSPTTTFQWVRDASKPPTPVLSSPSPNPYTSNGSSIVIAGSCSGSNTVSVTGSSTASATCSGGAFSLTFTKTSDGAYAYSVTQVSAINGSSSSAAVVTWTRDTVAPGAPTLTAIAPLSPAANQNPKVTGSAGAGATTVQLFRSADCSGAVAASGTTTAFAGGGIAVPALLQQAMSVSARDVDLAGNPSPCSATSLAYTHHAAQLVKDMNTSGSGNANPTAFAQVGTKVFFRASNGILGNELFVSDGTANGTRMVKDINVADSSNPTATIDFNGVAFFSADDGEHGSELWRSDGTDGGTTLVADINPGPFGSTPGNFFVAGETMYFSADDGTNGIELWKTDGTTNGTTLVADLEPGFGGSSPNMLRSVGGGIVFRATTTANGLELWKSNGTSAGTSCFELNTGAASGSPNYLVNWGSYVYFSGTDATTGSELWRTDGTIATRVADIYTGGSGSGPAYLTPAGSTLFFYARRSPSNVGYELFKATIVSGSEVVELVKDIYPGTSAEASSPVYITAVSATRVIFRATTAAEGQELWSSDGTTAGTVLLADINPGILHSGMTVPVVANGKAYFAGNTNGEVELWETDGTVAGTRRLDVNAGPNGSSPASLAVFNGQLIGSFQTNATGREAFLVDGAGAHLLADVNPIAASLPSAFVEYKGQLFFSSDDGVNGRELWKSDGTAGGTVMVKDIAPGADHSSPTALVVAGAYLYFRADDGNNGVELWRSDGTAEGTVLVTDICAGDGSSTPNYLVALGSQLIFVADDCASGIELWQATGTGAATMLKDVYAGATTSAPVLLTLMGSKVYFRATTAANGAELWATDGTTANTALVKDVRSGTSSASPSNLKVVGGTKLFFTATESATGVELYVSDGTSTGTLRLGDIYAGTPSSSPTNLVDMNGTLIFTATEPTNGRELYKSQGVSGDITLVKDIRTGAGSSAPASPLYLGGKVYFSAADDAAGSELWVTDGTSTGTTRIADARAGTAGSYPANLWALDASTIFFTANEGVNGTEPWRTNLTAAGTYLIQDINVLGPSWGSVSLAIGSTVYFTANDGMNGFELWKY